MLVKDIKEHSYYIFQHLASVTGEAFDTRKNVKAWFRRDKHPSAKFYKNSIGEYFYLDFAGVSFDCIAMWAAAYNVTNNEAINQLKAFLQLQNTPPPPPPPTPQAQQTEIVFLPNSELEASCNARHYPTNNLFVWFSGIVGNDTATYAAQKYNVGTSNKTFFGRGAAAFWYLDSESRPRYAKIVQYSHETGKRARNFKYPFLQPKHHIGKGLRPCFFGEHLIPSAPANQIVCIVESEKTALVCSVALPDFLWLASGGATGLGLDKVACLQGRTVYLIVDFDESGRTAYEKASKALTKAGIKNSIVDLFPNRADKADICDCIIENWQKSMAQPQSEQPQNEQPQNEQPQNEQPQSEQPQKSMAQPQIELPQSIAQHPNIALLLNSSVLDLEIISVSRY